MGNKLNEVIKSFVIYCQKNRIPQAALKGIPYIGESIEEVLYGGDMEHLIYTNAKISQEQQDEIIAKLEYLMDKFKDNARCIVAVGGGNAEYLYIADEIKIGQKNIVNDSVEMIGGGAVNFAARLLATGHEVYPILSLGNDRPGRKVRDALLEIAYSGFPSDSLIEFMKSNDFFVSSMKTSSATIIVQKTGRTALSYLTVGNEDDLIEFVEKRMREVQTAVRGYPAAIRVSHINRFRNTQNTEASGYITKLIIDKYKGRSILMINLGSSQIHLGTKYWESSLQNVDLVQLNLHEAKRLFSVDNSIKSPTLTNIIKWFQERKITAIITLSKFGAVGTYKDGKDGIVFAWPIETKDFVDPTGAGDAYSAGIASVLYDKTLFQFSDFLCAINEGKYWATYACTTMGGCGECPSLQTLKLFQNEIGEHDPTEVISQKNSEQTLRLIDKAYS